MSIIEPEGSLLEKAVNLLARIKSRDLLSLTVRSRDKILFQGEVKAVSSENEAGVFDVLPQHANFISIIKNNLVILEPNSQKRTFELKIGLLKVWENEAYVYLDILSPLKIGI